MEKNWVGILKGKGVGERRREDRLLIFVRVWRGHQREYRACV